MDTLIDEKEIEICSKCKTERKNNTEDYSCCECGADGYPFVTAVRQTISRILLKK